MMATALLGLVPLAGCLMVARRRYTVVSVNGGSMLPTLRPGDRVLVRRMPVGRVRVGDVVLCLHHLPRSPLADEGATARRRPIPTWVIKRVAAVPGDPVPDLAIPEPERIVPAGSVVLLGDNPAVSEDSRQAGFFRLEQIRGRVVRHLGR